jgi:hypothetical protein
MAEPSHSTLVLFGELVQQPRVSGSMTSPEPYNPLDLDALGDSLLRQLERQPTAPLDDVARFTGAGIYALYFHGRSDPYADIGEFNRKHGCLIPLYVGRARHAGARKGLDPFEAVTGTPLWGRVQEHRRSIENTDLRISDFSVRVLVCMPIWIPLAEGMMIRRYSPLWNTTVDGFGIHAPGSGRAGQQRSRWDVLHPGRSFARDLTPSEVRLTPALLEEVRRASRQIVRRATALLEQTVPDTGAPSEQRLPRA